MAIGAAIKWAMTPASEPIGSTSNGDGEGFQGPRSDAERTEILEKLDALSTEGRSKDLGWQKLADWGESQALQLQKDYGYEFGFTIQGTEANPAFGSFVTDFNSGSLPSLDNAGGFFRYHTHPDNGSHSGNDYYQAESNAKHGLKYSAVSGPGTKMQIYNVGKVYQEHLSTGRPMSMFETGNYINYR